MRIQFIVPIIVAGTFVTALPAFATQPPAAVEADRAATDSGGTGTARPDPNRQICVDERLSGSHITRRICRTAREWQAQQGEDDRL